jgi:hypothetical protein
MLAMASSDSYSRNRSARFSFFSVLSSLPLLLLAARVLLRRVWKGGLQLLTLKPLLELADLGLLDEF